MDEQTKRQLAYEEGWEEDPKNLSTIKCSQCGHRLRLKDRVWQLRHMAKHAAPAGTSHRPAAGGSIGVLPHVI